MVPGLLPLAICLTPAAALLAAKLALHGIGRRHDRHLDDLQAQYRRKEAIHLARMEAYRLERLHRAARNKADHG
jgi:DNA-binding transcriptional MocR family regulator